MYCTVLYLFSCRATSLFSKLTDLIAMSVLTGRHCGWSPDRSLSPKRNRLCRDRSQTGTATAAAAAAALLSRVETCRLAREITACDIDDVLHAVSVVVACL